MKKEASRLWDMGLAVHWLKPKSKRPIESKWTTGERKTRPELLRTFKTGFNMGVRLGRVSKVKDRYLAVIDCDVKSSDPNHERQLNEKLTELFGALHNTSFTKTGRGNGSRHIYVLTEKPVKSHRVGQSDDKVRVKMPSVQKASRYEQERLTAEEITQGWRIRPAWEISVMGDGSQCVLPPSIHPDTGKLYVWGKPLNSVNDLAVITLGNNTDRLIKEDNAPSSSVSDIGFESVDLLSIPKDLYDQITEGDGVEDRSAALFSVSMSLLRHGFTENEIISVLTDRSYFLGNAAFEHAQTKDRNKAAQWIKKFTLTKALNETSAKKEFENAVEISPLSEEATVIQTEELFTKKDWRHSLERTKDADSPPKSTLKNVILILENALDENPFERNLFSQTDCHTKKTPWGGEKGREINDTHVIGIKKWIADKFRFEPSTDKINEAIVFLADSNSYHPVKDYLESLEWDGTPRINNWLEDYCQAKAEEPYLSAISRKTLVAMVARIFEPGIKFDQVLILQGHQGYGKSTLLRNLVSDKWFSDSLGDITDKDCVLGLRNRWVLEIGEMNSMRKAETDQFKEFISRTEDRIRVPYGRRTESFPRQCVFIGTTNNEEYLRDVTGNRRFWPVLVGRCDFSGVRRDRDQLFAEALFYYELGEPLYLESEEMNEVAQREQELRMEHDPIFDEIQRMLLGQVEGFSVSEKGFVINEFFSDSSPLKLKMGKYEVMRVANCLRKLNYRKHRITEKRVRRMIWFKAKNEN